MILTAVLVELFLIRINNKDFTKKNYDIKIYYENFKKDGLLKAFYALGERLKSLEQRLNFLKRCKPSSIFPP